MLPNFTTDIKTRAVPRNESLNDEIRNLDVQSGRSDLDSMSTQPNSDVSQDTGNPDFESASGPASLLMSYHISEAIPAGIPEPKSIHAAAQEEARRHKWIESQKHGRDLGDTALREWYRLHWHDYCRNCHIEHLDGKQPWQEFDPRVFGHLLELMKSKDVLLERILDRICEGQENLEIVQWALEYSLPMDRVIRILEQLNVNAARFEPKIAIA